MGSGLGARVGAGAWAQGSSLFGSGAGSQGGRPDMGARDCRGVWVSRLLIRVTPAPPGPAPDPGSGPLAASLAGGAAGAPGNALPGIAALAAALAAGSCEISAHGGIPAPAPTG